VPTFHTDISPENGLQAFGFPVESHVERELGASIIVRAFKPSQQPRTLAKYQNGVSRDEAVRLSEAAHFMVRRGPAIFVSLSHADDDTAALRESADKIKNHVRTFAVRNGAPPWWADVWECRPRPNFHLIAAAPPGKVRRMCKGIKASTILGDIDARPVTDINGLINYLLKEQTTEAWYAAGRDMRRLKGSHKLPDGGDRQHLSRALEDELLRAGLIERWHKTNARRAAKLVNVEAINRDIERARVGLFFVDDLPEAKAPQKAKPAHRTSRKRDKIAPPSLPLPYAPTVAELLAGLGPTHEAIGERVGLSRPQVSNVIQGRFGVSRPIARRVLELSRATA